MISKRADIPNGHLRHTYLGVSTKPHPATFYGQAIIKQTATLKGNELKLLFYTFNVLAAGKTHHNMSCLVIFHLKKCPTYSLKLKYTFFFFL